MSGERRGKVGKNEFGGETVESPQVLVCPGESQLMPV